MTATHHLKTWVEYFEPVWDGTKSFEIRYDDRAFQSGDVVYLHEFDRSAHCECGDRFHLDRGLCERYTGRWVEATIGFLAASTPARGNQRGFEGRGYVVFALLDLVHSDDADVDSERPDCRCRKPRPTNGYTIGCPVHDPQLQNKAPSPLQLAISLMAGTRTLAGGPVTGSIAVTHQGETATVNATTRAHAGPDSGEGGAGVRTPDGPPGPRPASGPRPGREVPSTT